MAQVSDSQTHEESPCLQNNETQEEANQEGEMPKVSQVDANDMKMALKDTQEECVSDAQDEDLTKIQRTEESPDSSQAADTSRDSVFGSPDGGDRSTLTPGSPDVTFDVHSEVSFSIVSSVRLMPLFYKRAQVIAERVAKP